MLTASKNEVVWLEMLYKFGLEHGYGTYRKDDNIKVII